MGRVNGTVIEGQTQAPVPAATITLSGGSGVKKTTQTGEDGSFELQAIPPGTYDLVVTYEGLKPIKKRVVVEADASTPIAIVWTAETVAEETTVVEEERHLSRPDSSQTGQIYSTERTNQLPLARAYQAISTQVPGVTTGGGNPSVKGGRPNNNRLLVNGLDITDPVTNQATASFQMDALESVSLTTGGFEAKYNALGAITTLQTKRGTNRFAGSAAAYWAPTDLVDYSTYGPQIYDGAKPWDYSAERPTQGRYELNLNSQGPIVKDHLFFNAGVRYERSNQVQPVGPPRFVQAPSAVFESVYLLAGISYVPTNDHRLHVEGFIDPTSVDYENNNSDRANTTHPYSQTGRFAGGRRGTFEWSWQANKHVMTKVMLGGNESRIDSGPQGLRGIADKDLEAGVKYDFHRPAHTNTDDGTLWFNTSTSHAVVVRRRFQLDASVTANAEAFGKHEAEFGVQSSFTEQRVAVSFPGGSSGSDDTSGFGLFYTDRGGGPLNTGLCDLDPYVNPAAVDGVYTGAGCNRRTFTRSFASHQSGNQMGVYLQDRYKPRRWLTILPGLRWDTGTVRATDSNVAMTANGFGPRLSLIADVTNDQKTIAQVSYGRMTEMPALGGVNNYDSTRRNATVTQQYNATTRRFEFQQTGGGAQGVRLNFDRTPATADELLLSARREIKNGVLVRADYTYRVYRRQFEGAEVNAIMDPTGTRTIGFVNGVPMRVTEYGFNPRSYAKYSGLDLILETRAGGLEVQGGYTLSQSWGTAGSGSFDNPRFEPFYQSYQSVDVRHQIKSSTTFSWENFTIGLILNWRSGSALAASYSSAEPGYTVRRAPTGVDTGAYYNTGTGNPYQNGTYSDLRSWTAFRTPDVLTCNMMLSYNFEKLIKQRVIANLQINNVLALDGATGVNTTQGSPNGTQFGLASNRQGFRTFTIGLRYEL